MYCCGHPGKPAAIRKTSLNQQGNKYSYLGFTIQVAGERTGNLFSPVLTTQLGFVWKGLWGLSGAEQLPTAGWAWTGGSNLLHYQSRDRRGGRCCRRFVNKIVIKGKFSFREAEKHLSNQQAVFSERKEQMVSEKLEKIPQFLAIIKKKKYSVLDGECFAAITKLSHLILGCGAVWEYGCAELTVCTWS